MRRTISSNICRQSLRLTRTNSQSHTALQRRLLPSTTSIHQIHTTSSSNATALPITSSGPPPPVPEPEPTFLHRSRLRTASLPKPKTTRFWSEATISTLPSTDTSPARLVISLDKRPLKTPNRNPLAVSTTKPLLAYALALEWSLLRASTEATRPHLIPLTSLTARAIDLEHGDASISDPDDQRLKSTRKEIVDFLMRYLETDTLLLIAPTANENISGPGELQVRDLQLETANDMISWCRATLGDVSLEILISDGDEGILPKKQPVETVEFIKGYISGLGDYELVGLERAVLAGKSLLAGLRLVVENSGRGGVEGKGRWSVEDAAKACNLETDWQIGKWGAVEDTHDVNEQDLRRQLGSVMLLIGEC